MPRMNNDQIFKREIKLLNRFEEVFKSEVSDLDFLTDEYFKLGKGYRSLLRQTKKLVSISDRTQRDLYDTREELQKQYAYIDNELNRAVEHVKSILPSPLYEINRITIDWKYVPSSKLGGDIFGYHYLDEKRLAIYLIDVCGHGIGPALHSVSVLNTIKFHSLPRTDFADPGSVLTSLNRNFSMFDHNNTFFTMWYFVLNMENGELRYSGAGHPPFIIVRPDKSILLKDSDNPPVGTAPDFEFNSNSITIKKGTSIYLYTDGVYEVKNKDNKYMEFSEFTEYLSELENRGVPNLDDLLKFSIHYSYNGRLEDDFTILRICFNS